MNEPRIEVVYDYKHQATETKPGTVWVRVFFSRTNRKYISTGVRVLPSEWSDMYHVVRRDDSVQLNMQIDEQVEQAKSAISLSMKDNDIPTKEMMKVNRDDASFLNFVRNEIEIADLADGTRKHHYTMLSSLEEFGKIRRFEHVTNNRLDEYIKFISSGKEQVTIHDYYKRLRVYVRKAQKLGFIPMSVGIEVKRGSSKEREHLTDDEVKKWCEIDLPFPYLRDARDRFIVQMGTGLSYADLMDTDFTRAETVDGVCTLSGRRTKTNKPYFLVILPMAQKVLEKWGWNVPAISNTHYNDYLDAVAIRAGINKHITSHVGRHTYACQCLSHGVRIEAVQRTLGHTKISTTQIYARMMDMDVVNAFKKLK